MVKCDLPKVETRVRFSHSALKYDSIKILQIIFSPRLIRFGREFFMKNVTIYTTPSCHFCHMAKEFFKENNVAYTEYDVAGNAEKRKFC